MPTDNTTQTVDPNANAGQPIQAAPTSPDTSLPATQSFDPAVVALMHGIKVNEGANGNYNALGDKLANGQYTAAGIAQWSNQQENAAGKYVPVPLQPGQIPTNFQSMATKYGLDPNDFSPANQNKVLYADIAAKKAAGLTPEQILSEHNSGNPNAYLSPATSTGVGSVGAYNVANYVKNGMAAAQAYAAQNQQQNSGTTTPAPTATPSTSWVPQVNTGNSTVDTVANGVIGFGKNLIAGITNPLQTIGEGIGSELSDLVNGQPTPDQEAQYTKNIGGTSPGKMANIFGDQIDQAGYENGVKATPLQSAEQTGGNIALTALNAFTLGEGGAAIDVVKGVGEDAGEGLLTTAAKQTLLQNAWKPALIGAGYGAAGSYANDPQGSFVSHVLNAGLGAIVGGTLGIGTDLAANAAQKIIGKKILSETQSELEDATAGMTPAEMVSFQETPKFQSIITNNLEKNPIFSFGNIDQKTTDEAQKLLDYISQNRKLGDSMINDMGDNALPAAAQVLKSMGDLSEKNPDGSLKALTQSGAVSAFNNATTKLLANKYEEIPKMYDAATDLIKSEPNNPLNNLDAQQLLQDWQDFRSQNRGSVAEEDLTAAFKKVKSQLGIKTDADEELLNPKSKISPKDILDTRSIYNQKGNYNNDDPSSAKATAGFMRYILKKYTAANPSPANNLIKAADNVYNINEAALKIAKAIHFANDKSSSGSLHLAAAYTGLKVVGSTAHAAGPLGFEAAGRLGEWFDNIATKKANLALLQNRFTRIMVPELKDVIANKIATVTAEIKSNNFADATANVAKTIDTIRTSLGQVKAPADLEPIIEKVQSLPEGPLKDAMKDKVGQIGKYFNDLTGKVEEYKSKLAGKTTPFAQSDVGTEGYTPDNKLPVIDAGNGPTPPPQTPAQATALAKMKKSSKGLPTVLQKLSRPIK